MTENDQPHLDKGASRRFQISEWLLVAVLAYLLLAWALFILYDILDLAIIPGRALLSGTEVPFFFYHLFKEGSPTEMLQWFMLAASIMVCGAIYGHESDRGRSNQARFFIIVGLGICLMLMEDAGNVRHQVANYTTVLFAGAADPRAIRTITEFSIYALMGGLMVYPVLRYWRDLQLSGKTRLYLLGGYCAYAAASILSASRYIYRWYESFGDSLIPRLPLGNPSAWQSANLNLIESGRFSMGFWLMDYLMEESLELLAASLLLAFFLSYKKSLKR